MGVVEEESEAGSMRGGRSWSSSCRHWVRGLLSRHGYSILAAVPPLLIAASTKSVDALVSFTGSFAGLAIQYIIPAWLVYSSRRYVASLQTDALARTDADIHADAPPSPSPRSSISPLLQNLSCSLPFPVNVHRSPFSHPFWVYLIFVWSGLSLIMNCFNVICKNVDSCKAAVGY
eukprot:TRINITY_DN5251_c0_g1_i2.p1 TRINITY_DN5251_c0_g1~~TRINITY_DN5251_c0_g1_i2.p1  ORF type:complete len:175 (+),score=57.45 TRINITY_DN5251_c0_g1_i2:77-601(+)